MDFKKITEIATDIYVSLKMTDVDIGAYIEAAKEKTALLIAELEKPADENALSVVKNWDAKHRGRYVTLDYIHRELATDIEQYAESYHAKQCRTCSKLENALDTHTRDRDAEIERIAEKD